MLQIARPCLPRAEALLPYLHEIDEARWYTNRGPLVRRFEARLGEHFRTAGGSTSYVATVSCATTGLILALKAAVGARRGACLLPSWTFAATAGAVLAAGLTPHFVDVEPETWLVDRRQVAELLAAAPRDFVALLLVHPAGMRIDLEPWQQLADAHGLALVVDAADGFDAVRPEPGLQIVSLHACKAFGIGEGGFVLSSDAGIVESIRRLANFGFDEGRAVETAGINGKLSEYAAAVGHAALDAWPQTRARWRERAESYRRLLAIHDFELLFSTGAARATALVDLGGPYAAAAAAALQGQGVEARRWWGEGCHRQPAFAACPRTKLPVTDALAARILGLPFHIDLDDAAMAHVVELLARFVRVERG